MELKRCPFCGGDAEFIRGGCGFGYQIMCCDCNIIVGTFDDMGAFRPKQKAIDAWNRRV